jgi:hypothetical protein
MTYYYSLQIDAPEDQYDEIDIILGVKSNFALSAGWGIELVEKKEDESVFFIKYFLSILEGKYEKLEKIGITRDNISLWMLYEYEGQCNMEFSPKDMYNLGKEGIVLCISCWEN